MNKVNYNAYPENKDSGIKWLGEVPIEWKIDNSGVSLTFYKPKESYVTDVSITGGQADKIETLTKRQLEVFNLIKNGPTISRRRIAEKMEIYESGVQKHLEALKKKGVIKRHGETTGYCEVHS